MKTEKYVKIRVSVKGNSLIQFIFIKCLCMPHLVQGICETAKTYVRSFTNRRKK